MVEIGDEDMDYADRIASKADVLKDAWTETIDDMKSLAAELEEDGWDAFYVAAGHTAPEHPDAGQDDRWGLVHVIPDNFADEFEEAFDEGDFPVYDVYRQEVDGNLFYVTLLQDPESEQAILLAGSLELFQAGPLVRKTKEEGHLLTHVQTLDGTHRGSFRHDEPAKFFPHYAEFSDRYDHDPITGAEPGEGHVTSLEDADEDGDIE